MKKITYILAFAALVGTTLFTSCSPDKDDKPPTIEFVPDATTATKGPGEIINFDLILKSTGKNLRKLDITRQYGSIGNDSNWQFTSFDKSEALTGTTQKYYFIDTIPFGINTVKYSFTLTKENSKLAYKEFTITVKQPITWGTITRVVESFVMDNQFTPSGSQFWGLSLTNKALDIATAKTNADKIDFVFGHRSAVDGGAFLGGPYSADARVIYDNTSTSPDKLSTWSVSNKTLFKTTTLTPAEFDNCTSDSMILAQTAIGVNNDSYKTVKENEVVAFITKSGKKGLFKVVSVSGSFDSNTAGEINFDLISADK